VNVCVSAGDVYVAADSGRDTLGVTSLVLRSMDTVQGYKVLGHQKEEKALLMGTRLTAIGEVVNTSPAVCFWPLASCLYTCILCTLRSLFTHTSKMHMLVHNKMFQRQKVCEKWFLTNSCASGD